MAKQQTVTLQVPKGFRLVEPEENGTHIWDGKTVYEICGINRKLVVIPGQKDRFIIHLGGG